MTHEEAVDFIEMIRAVFRLRCLPVEPQKEPERYSLDGVEMLTTAEWAKKFGVSRQAIHQRRDRMFQRKLLGLNPYENRKPGPKSLVDHASGA